MTSLWLTCYLDQALDNRSSQNIKDAGYAFLEQLKNTRDKQNHQIAENFYELPDKKKFPDYYQKIGLPISINIVEDKIKNGQYTDLTGIESDMRRLISNAKSYNNRTSSLFSDAEKIRKMLSNYMIKNNPAYKTGNYIPAATPVPNDWKPPGTKQEDAGEEDAEGETDDEEPVPVQKEPLSAARSSAPSTSDKRATSSTPAIPDFADEKVGFEGLDFQEAQEKIVQELINSKNAE